MGGYWFNDMKPSILYLIHNKVWNCYKFGVTAKSIEDRLTDYIKYKNLNLCDIDLLFCIKTSNAKNIEKELLKIINGYRYYEKDNAYPFKEHFIDKDNNLDEVKAFFKKLKEDKQ